VRSAVTASDPAAAIPAFHSVLSQRSGISSRAKAAGPVTIGSQSPMPC